MDQSKRLVIIPAYNELTTIATVVAQVRAYSDVLVVDDASVDNTAAEAKRAGALVVKNSINLGYDGALNRGFFEAAQRGYQYIVTLDADGQHEPTLLNNFFDPLEANSAQLILGCRPEKARIAEVLMGLYFKSRFGISDILCGMKGYDIQIYKEYGHFDRHKLIGTELALWALKKKFLFREVPVPIHSRKDKPRLGNTFTGNYKILRALIRTMAFDLNSSPG